MKTIMARPSPELAAATDLAGTGKEEPGVLTGRFFNGPASSKRKILRAPMSKNSSPVHTTSRTSPDHDNVSIMIQEKESPLRKSTLHPAAPHQQ
jgi:hypothetical protein